MEHTIQGNYNLRESDFRPRESNNKIKVERTFQICDSNTGEIVATYEAQTEKEALLQDLEERGYIITKN